MVENRPGAGGLLGNEAVANSPKDGYTLGVQTAGQLITPVMTKNVRFDAVESFDWIGQIAVAGLLIVVRPDYPHKDIKSLVAAAKAEPGKIVFASPGFGATQHLAAELFKQVAGVDMLHVPYRTSPEALASLISKNTDVLFDTMTALLGQAQSGQVRALAITGKDRDPAAPDIPTAAESGVVPNYDVTTWYGLYGPKGMPPAVIAKLNKALNEILAGAGDPRPPGQDRRDREELDAGSLAPVHGGRVQEVDRRAREVGAGAALATCSLHPPLEGEGRLPSAAKAGGVG